MKRFKQTSSLIEASNGYKNLAPSVKENDLGQASN